MDESEEGGMRENMVKSVVGCLFRTDRAEAYMKLMTKRYALWYILYHMGGA